MSDKAAQLMADGEKQRHTGSHWGIVILAAVIVTSPIYSLTAQVRRAADSLEALICFKGMEMRIRPEALKPCARFLLNKDESRG